MSRLVPLQNTSVSSTKSRWVKFMPGAMINPVKSPLLTASFRKRLSASATRRKIRGESGHPCQSPHFALKKGEATPLMRTAKEAVEMHPITHLTNPMSKPR